MMKCAIYYTMLVLYASQVYAQKSTDPQDALSAENILKSVKIQNIVFEKVSMETVVRMVFMKVRVSPGGDKINLEMHIPAGEKNEINLKQQNASAYKVLQDACKQAGLKFETDQNRVLIGDIKKGTAPLETQLAKRLQNIHIKKIDFEEAKLKDVFDHIIEQAKKANPPVLFKIKIVNKNNVEIAPITMSFDNISIADALRYICFAANCDLEYKKADVVVMAKEPLIPRPAKTDDDDPFVE